MNWRMHKGDMFEMEVSEQAAKGNSMECPGCGTVINDEDPVAPSPWPAGQWNDHHVLYCQRCSLWAMLHKREGVPDAIAHPADKPCGFCVLELFSDGRQVGLA